jgi:hypothetical protein
MQIVDGSALILPALLRFGNLPIASRSDGSRLWTMQFMSVIYGL